MAGVCWLAKTSSIVLLFFLFIFLFFVRAVVGPVLQVCPGFQPAQALDTHLAARSSAGVLLVLHKAFMEGVRVRREQKRSCCQLRHHQTPWLSLVPNTSSVPHASMLSFGVLGFQLLRYEGPAWLAGRPASLLFSQAVLPIRSCNWDPLSKP